MSFVDGADAQHGQFAVRSEARPEGTRLDVYHDLVAEAERQQRLWPMADPGEATRRRIRECLGFGDETGLPRDVRTERRWQDGGVVGEEVSWSVGYGPRTHAFFLCPAEASGPLPGVLALHDHGGFKYYGKEKIADGPGETPAPLVAFRDTYYGGRAFANVLAKEGFAVLAPDVFCWGSRRFPLAAMMASEGGYGDQPHERLGPVESYNAVAQRYEHVISKYCTILGSTFAGVVAHEDRVALSYLRSRPEVESAPVGAIGLSGGALRTSLLLATAEHLGAAAVVGIATTYPSLLDGHAESHTWMLFPAGLSHFADWPDVIASQAPVPLLVQYDLDDQLFTRDGMAAAHERIRAHYKHAGAPYAYSGQFYPGPHKFDVKMQAAAFSWLRRWLAPVNR